MEYMEKNETEMTEDEKAKEAIIPNLHIYPPPLFESIPLIDHWIKMEKDGWNALTFELRDLLKHLKVKRPIRSLPCLFGPSPKKILLYADTLFWHDPIHVMEVGGVYGEQAGNMLYQMKKGGLWAAQRFCPVLIGRAPGPAKNKTAVMVLYAYEVLTFDDPTQHSTPPKELKRKIILDTPILVSSLDLKELESVIPRLHLQITPKSLQRILLSQVATLYGAVPSFIYHGREDERDDITPATLTSTPAQAKAPKTSIPQSVEDTSYLGLHLWNGGNSTVFLHPTVAHWWMLALNYQAQYLAERGHNYPFPWDHYAYEEKITHLDILGHKETKIQYKNDLNDFYREQTSTHNSDSTPIIFIRWKKYLKHNLLSSVENSKFLMTHHIFSPDQQEPAFEWERYSKTEADKILHASSSNYSCASLYTAKFSCYNLKVPPLPLPVRFFLQNQKEHELLTQSLSDACLGWVNYTQRNSSRLFFIAALLYAYYQSYYPIASPTDAMGVQVFENRKNCLFLVIDDPAVLIPTPDSAQEHATETAHPLGRSSELWYTEHVPPRTSIRTVTSHISKITQKMCVILFEGEARNLTPSDCDKLLCSADVVVLGNVSLPKGYHTLHLSVAELGIPRSEDSSSSPAFSLGSNYFPTRHDFDFLQLAVTRSLCRYMWYEFNQKCFHLNLSSHEKFLKSPSFASCPRDYEYLLIRSMRYSKVQTKDALNYLKRLVLLQYQSRTSAGKLSLYLPFLISTLLILGCYYCTSTLNANNCFLVNPFSLEMGTRKKKAPQPVPEEKLKESRGMKREPVYIKSTPEQQLTEARKRYTRYFAPYLASASQKKEQTRQLLEDSYKPFLYFIHTLRMNHPDKLCNSKQEYLRRKAEGTAPLGWVSQGKIYLDHELYWPAFCKSIKDGDRLLSKRLAFLKNVLAPKLGDLLYRDDAKSGHWYCRFSTWENGKSKRIGSFLVLSSRVTHEV